MACHYYRRGNASSESKQPATSGEIRRLQPLLQPPGLFVSRLFTDWREWMSQNDDDTVLFAIGRLIMTY